MSTISAYTGDGSTKQFDITFTYRNASTIIASINGVETTAFTFVNASRIEFSAAPATGSSIKIFRRTPTTPAEVTFNDGAIVRGSDLNGAIAQPRDAVEEYASEVLDLRGSALRGPAGETFAALPAADARKGLFLGFGTGDGLPILLPGTGNATAMEQILVGQSGNLGQVIRFSAPGYGLSESNTAAANLTAMQAAVAAAASYASATAPVAVSVPPGTYQMGHLGIEAPNVWIVAHGATFVEGRISTSPAAEGFRLYGGRFYYGAADAILTINSSNGGVFGVHLEKHGAGDGYMMMTEAVTGNIYQGITLRGGNGLFVEGEKLVFSNIHGIGRAAGGDDFIVLKARGRRTGDIAIVGVYAENYSNVIAFGSEIGTLGVNSATRAGRVENVQARDIVARNCTYVYFIKPGAIDVAGAGASAYDWRDGLVRGLDLEARVADLDGTKLARALVISGARNALVEKIDLRLRGEGRFASTADTEAWVHVYWPDSTAYAAPGSGATIQDVFIDVKGMDLYGGVDNGAGTPGNPPQFGVNIEKQNSAVGTGARIRVLAELEGTKAAGINVGPGLDNVVTVERFIGRAICNAPPSTQGGITTQSILRAPGENDIAMANTSYKPVHLSGTGDVIGRTMKVWLAEQVSAGNADSRAVKLPPHKLFLRKITGINKLGFAADDVNYTGFAARALGSRYDGTAASGNQFALTTTQATGGIAITANTEFSLTALATGGVGADYLDRFLGADAGLLFEVLAGGGTGRTTQKLEMTVHYVQLGPLS